jgi:hypothetical protein
MADITPATPTIWKSGSRSIKRAAFATSPHGEDRFA